MDNGSLLKWAWMVHLGRNAHSYSPHTSTAQSSTLRGNLPASLPACMHACLIQARGIPVQTKKTLCSGEIQLSLWKVIPGPRGRKGRDLGLEVWLGLFSSEENV